MYGSRCVVVCRAKQNAKEAGVKGEIYTFRNPLRNLKFPGIWSLFTQQPDYVESTNDSRVPAGHCMEESGSWLEKAGYPGDGGTGGSAPNRVSDGFKCGLLAGW